MTCPIVGDSTRMGGWATTPRPTAKCRWRFIGTEDGCSANLWDVPHACHHRIDSPRYIHQRSPYNLGTSDWRTVAALVSLSRAEGCTMQRWRIRATSSMLLPNRYCSSTNTVKSTAIRHASLNASL